MKLFIVTMFLVMLSACNLGEVDLRAPNLNATYVGQQVSGYKATIDNASAFYSTSIYDCIDSLFYRQPIPPSIDFVPINNLDGSIASCADVPFTYIEIINTDLPFIAI